MSKVSTATIENLLTEPFITDYNHVFFNEGTKKFPKNSLSIEVTNNTEMTKFKKICEKVDIKTPFKKNKEGNKLYVKFGIPESLRVYDEERKLIENADIEKLLKTKDARIAFSVNKYTMAGVSGISFRAQQLQVKDKDDKFKDCFF